MATKWDAEDAELLVLTKKEGLLSKVAHDLKLRVTRFELSLEDGEAPRIELRCDAASLRVVNAMKGGRDAPELLSAGDRKKIEANIVGEVLHAKRHPEIRFVSTRVTRRGDTAEIAGTLALHGRERPLEATARRRGSRWVTEVSLHQPDFGIRPYSAMLGALKVAPDVAVRFEAPA